MSKKYEAVRAANLLELPKALTQVAQGKQHFTVIQIQTFSDGKCTAIVEYEE